MREGGRGAKSYDGEKAWSSINHSILFVWCLFQGDRKKAWYSLASPRIVCLPWWPPPFPLSESVFLLHSSLVRVPSQHVLLLHCIFFVPVSMKRARQKSSWYDTPNDQYRQLESNGIVSRALDRPIYVFPEMNCAASFPIPTFMYLWGIYIFPGPICPIGHEC